MKLYVKKERDSRVSLFCLWQIETADGRYPIRLPKTRLLVLVAELIAETRVSAVRAIAVAIVLVRISVVGLIAIALIALVRVSVVRLIAIAVVGLVAIPIVGLISPRVVAIAILVVVLHDIASFLMFEFIAHLRGKNSICKI